MRLLFLHSALAALFIFSFVSSPLVRGNHLYSDSSVAHNFKNHHIRRQAETSTTTAETVPETSNAGTTATNTERRPRPPMNDGYSEDNVLISLFVGILLGVTVVLASCSVLTAVAIFWGYKIKKRRQRDRDLVVRTKKDIFEGVPNVITSEGDVSINLSRDAKVATY